MKASLYSNLLQEFNPTVEPWLAQPIEIRRYNEL